MSLFLGLMPDPKVALVILNWNGKQVTAECLDSLKKIDYSNYEIVLVDNGSKDGSVEFFEKNYPYLTIIKNKQNLGFTGGNNVGIKKALEHNVDYVMLLNNDTLVEPNLLSALVGVAETDQKIGIVGPKIVYHAQPEILWFAGGTYFPLLGKARTIGVNKKDVPIYNQQRDVDWFTGCCMLIRRSVLEKIGFLDESYFSSYEDVDFCLRVTAQNFRIVYCPTTKIYHKVAQDWKGIENPLYIYYQIRNNLLFIKKNLTGIKKYLAYSFLTTFSFPRRLLRFYRNKEFYKRKYLFMAVKDFLNHHYGKGKLSQTIVEELKHKKMRIGINARYLQRQITGIERYILELIQHLEKIDTKSEYVLFFNKHKNLPKLLHNRNVTYYVSPRSSKTRFWRILWEQFFLAFELKKNNIDVFHGPAFVLPLIKPCKYVVTVHDLSHITHPQGYTFLNRLYLHLFMRRSLKLADVVIADSYATKNDLLKFFSLPQEKIRVIYLGYTPPLQTVSKPKYFTMRDPFILCVGSLIPRKNIERCIDAYHQLHKKGLKHKLVIIGKMGWLYQPILEKIAALKLKKDVLLQDYVEEHDLGYFYKNAEVLLFPSLYEGFGLPILEAMSSGCPVITSNISSMPEVAGAAALYVNPVNTSEIVQALEQIMHDKNLRETLINKGYEQVKKFSWQKTAEETLKVYKELGR